MSDKEGEKEVLADRYRRINLTDQLTRLLEATGGDERVLILQLEIWQKQANVIVPMSVIEDAQDRATTASFLRQLADTANLDETLPVQTTPKGPFVEEVLRKVVEETGPLTGEETDPVHVSPTN